MGGVVLVGGWGVGGWWGVVGFHLRVCSFLFWGEGVGDIAGWWGFQGGLGKELSDRTRGKSGGRTKPLVNAGMGVFG